MKYILQNTYPKLLDIRISDIFNMCHIDKDPDEILFIQGSMSVLGGGIRQNIRNNNLVDQHIYNRCYNDINNPIFTWLDFIGHNVVNCPLGFMSPNNIQQNDQYHLEYHKNNEFYNRIFWRGSKTHDIRNVIVNYFKSHISVNTNIDVDYWNLDKKYSVYDKNKKKPPSSEYTTYFRSLQNSDLFLVIRGDKPWTNSFFDCLRANTIPVCIDTFYGKLGWENIGFKTEDLLLDINTESMGMEEIYEKIIHLSQNREKILYMKNNLHIFFNRHILSDRILKDDALKHKVCAGWGDFYCAKILEIQRNNFKLSNNQFISSIIHEIKQ